MNAPTVERLGAWALGERTKELKCVYDVTSALSRMDAPQAVFDRIVRVIPRAWQYPEDAAARIEFFGRTHAAPGFIETPWRLRSTISLWRKPVGAIEVVYRQPRPSAWEGPFLEEERQLLDHIACRLGDYLEWKQRELGGATIGAAPDHWRWRQRFAERLAAAMDPGHFGVRGVYLYGSTEVGDASAGSDIDLIIVFAGTSQQKRDLCLWLDAWSVCLAQLGLELYGFPGEGLLDVRFVDADRADVEIKSFVAGGSTIRALPLGDGTMKAGDP